MAKINKYPLHFLVMAVLPVVSEFGQNTGLAAFAGTIRSYVVFLSSTLFFFAAVIYFLRNHHQAALIVSFGLLLFYLVMPLQNFFIVRGILWVRVRFLVPLFLLAFLAGTWWGIRRIKHPERLTGMVNLIALSTLVIPFYQIGSYQVVIRSPETELMEPFAVSIPPEVSGEKGLPDVYYIILDGHGRADDILGDFGYDLSPNLEKLMAMGFYVAQCSNANYPDSTWQSMNASLNMRYFDHEQARSQPPAKTVHQAFQNIQDNEVMNVFEELGYTTVAFSTLFEFVNIPRVDIYYDFFHFSDTNIRHFNQFESALLKDVPVGAFIDDYVSIERAHYGSVLRVLKSLRELPQEAASPKFVYAHLVVPHTPFAFSSSGGYLVEGHYDFSPEKYTDQVEYIDEQIVDVVTQIIRNSPTPPIIIIQGDHGIPLAYVQSGAVGQRPGILNAYYFPEENDRNDLYPSISPVNTFRLIFNLYFSANLDLLPDRIYRDNLADIKSHKSANAPYDFTEEAPEVACSGEKQEVILNDLVKEPLVQVH